MFQLYLAILGIIAFLSLKPDFCKSIGIKLIYNIIYFYSACQIKCTQAYNYLLPYFKSDEIIDKVTIEQFNIYTNDLVTTSKHTLDVADIGYELNNELNKLFIVSKSCDDSLNASITNKLIIDKNNVCLLFDVSKIIFVALYLNYNSVRYNINLKTNDFNYYLVGNVIDKYFVQYYINTVLGLKFSYTDPEITTYQLELLDNNVNMVYLNYDQSIFIDKDRYHIINKDESEEKDES